MSEDKNRVARLRRRAYSQKFTLTKIRIKNHKAPEFGMYRLVDWGGDRKPGLYYGRPWMSLDEVEYYLDREPGIGENSYWSCRTQHSRRNGNQASR